MIKYTRSFVDDIENHLNIDIEIEQDLTGQEFYASEWEDLEQEEIF